MAKRYDDLSDALEELSVHAKADEDEYAARSYQIAASGLRTVESIPPNPCDLDCVDETARDAVAEWRGYGEIDKLQELQDKRPYLSELTRVKLLGPETAKRLHEQHDVHGLDDLKEMLESGEIEDVHGIGSSTATTFRRSIAQMD